MVARKKDVAALVYQLRRLGIKADEYVVVPEGVFFNSSKSANIFAKKHDKELTHIDEQVWLASEEQER